MMPDKRGCQIRCSSECCYSPDYIFHLTGKQIRNLKSSVRNRYEEIDPQYRKIVVDMVKNEGFVKSSYGRKYLTVDKTKPGFSAGLSTLSRPCVFLASTENISNNNKPCMIYPFRFDFCIETTTDDCLPGLDAVIKL